MAKQGRRRARRSTQTSRELENARARNVAQLAEHQRKQQAIEQALEAYYATREHIAAVTEECDRKVTPHENAIAALHERRDQQVARFEAEQAELALVMHEADRMVGQVGELLGISDKDARQLIAAGRAARADTGREDAEDPGENALPDAGRAVAVAEAVGPGRSGGDPAATASTDTGGSRPTSPALVGQ
jgi:hypothetical protein